MIIYLIPLIISTITLLLSVIIICKLQPKIKLVDFVGKRCLAETDIDDSGGVININGKYYPAKTCYMARTSRRKIRKTEPVLIVEYIDMENVFVIERYI